MRLILSVLVCASLPARVVVISLDGMGHLALKQDPVAQEMKSLQALAAAGVSAAVRPHFPSTTANSHAALFTGAWGDGNGITSNSVALIPRAEHSIFDRISGYRSEALRAEPLWVAAARQGIRTVAVQVPQAYPFRDLNVGRNLTMPPVVVNGYQTRLLAPHMVIRRANARREDCPAAAAGAECFVWTAASVTLHGEFRGDRMTVSASGSAAVTARLAPLETQPPRERELARHFSEGLYLDNVGAAGPVVIYFRLFEASGGDFLLYQSPMHELGIHHGGEDSLAIARQLLKEAGGFIGNGPNASLLGTLLWKGGDGSAERRYLEAAELVTRQAIRQLRWFEQRYSPELLLGYLPFPDETEHEWKGAADVDPRYNEFRRWAFVMVDRFAATFTSARNTGDHLVFVSDHGMASVSRDVGINTALAGAGLLTPGPNGRPDPARTRALHVRNCVVVNTSDWKDGIVPPAERARTIAQVKTALAAIRDPESGRAVITRFYDSPADAARFGFGGPNGAEMCLDFLPGYAASDNLSGPVVRKRDQPAGYHGFVPDRPEMKAIFAGAGPRLPRNGTQWPEMRGIDVSPLVAQLLGISPPQHARGRSPMKAVRKPAPPPPASPAGRN